MAVGFSNQEPYDQERRRAHGRYDYVVPHVLWDGVAAKLPNATLRIFQESGHQPFFEEPERFAAAVTHWMSRQP